MGNCKFPISDEKLEMVCDKGDIYHCQYLRSNCGERKSQIVFKKVMDLRSLCCRRWVWTFTRHQYQPWR